MNFAKFLRTPFLIVHLWWLFLIVPQKFLELYNSSFSNFFGPKRVKKLATISTKKFTREVLSIFYAHYGKSILKVRMIFTK